MVQSILKRRASAPRRIGARAHVLYARQRALFYRDVLLPLRQRIVEQSLEQYNAMQLGVFQLLAAQRAQVAAGRGYIAALREYWTARARLGLVLAGGLVEPRAEPEGGAAAPTGTEADAGDGEAATLVGEP